MDHETQITPANKPSFLVYQISERADSNFWTAIGAAWPHKDGKGFTVQLNSLPLNGRVTLRPVPDQQN